MLFYVPILARNALKTNSIKDSKRGFFLFRALIWPSRASKSLQNRKQNMHYEYEVFMAIASLILYKKKQGKTR